MDTSVFCFIINHASHLLVEKGERSEQNVLATHHKAEARSNIFILSVPLPHGSYGRRGGGVAQLGRLRTLDYFRRIEPLRTSRGVGRT